MIPTTRVIFNGLGPTGVFHHEGSTFTDGNSPVLPIDVALSAVQGGRAIPFTDKDQSLVETKLTTNATKRLDIAKKIASINEGGRS